MPQILPVTPLAASVVWIFPVLFVGLFVALIVAVVRYEKKRVADLKTLAGRLGMDFSETGVGIQSEGFYDFPLFGKGHSKKSANVFREAKGSTQTVVFEYRYTTGGGKHSHTHNQTVVAFKKEGAALPGFAMGPENVMHRFGEKFGMQDIDFDGNEVFSRSYLLQGDDETAIRRTFEGGLVRYFARNPKWNVDAGGEWLLVYRAGKRPKVVEVPILLKDAIEVAREFGFI
jgi:hypothetical protein